MSGSFMEFHQVMIDLRGFVVRENIEDEDDDFEEQGKPVAGRTIYINPAMVYAITEYVNSKYDSSEDDVCVIHSINGSSHTVIGSPINTTQKIQTYLCRDAA